MSGTEVLYPATLSWSVNPACLVVLLLVLYVNPRYQCVVTCMRFDNSILSSNFDDMTQHDPLQLHCLSDQSSQIHYFACVTQSESQTKSQTVRVNIT